MLSISHKLLRLEAQASSTAQLQGRQVASRTHPVRRPRSPLWIDAPRAFKQGSDILATILLRLTHHAGVVLAFLYVVAVVFLVMILMMPANRRGTRHDGRDPPPALGSPIMRAVIRLLRCCQGKGGSPPERLLTSSLFLRRQR